MNSNGSLQTSLTLLRRIEADDQEAWNLFTRLYGPLVYSWCRNAGLQPDDVDDVGQEVFRVVSLKLGTFETDRKSSGAFRSWLWGIARLKILDHLRAIQRQPIGKGGTDHNLSLQSLEEKAAEPDSIDGMTPQQLLLKNAVSVLQDQFDPRIWQAFWGMAVKGRPARDIGMELEMTPKAVRQAKFRVVKKLREFLDEDFSKLVG